MKVVELDVREDLKNKKEPFQKIMEAIQGLKDGDVFILHAPFQPTPLYSVLGAKGFKHVAEELNAEHWKMTFTKESAVQ